MSKFLITAGLNTDGWRRDSRMLDLSIKGGSNCKDWAEIPKDVEAAIGGVIQEAVIVCGGEDQNYNIIDECYRLNSKTATLFTHMSAKRLYAASLVIDKTKLWITGGYSDDTGRLASSEYITLEGSEPGPELPIPINSHALVAIDNTLSMLIGGSTTENVATKTTHYFDHQSHNWIQGPDLMQARWQHAAGMVTDQVTNEKLVIVTGGFHNPGITLDYTEMLINNQWNQGKIAHCE